MDTKEIIRNWSIAQKAGAVLPCPRCGCLSMKDSLYKNALSRRADIYICDRCGGIEALEDVPYSQKANVEFFKKPLDEWFAVREVYGNGVSEKLIGGGFAVHAHCVFEISQEDIDDIMVAALEGGINYWCKEAEIVEEDYLGEFASDQLSRGGSLRLYDFEGGNTYLLTLDKFFKGLSLLVERGLDEYHAVSDGKVDPCHIDAEIADRIIQLAIFEDIIYA